MSDLTALILAGGAGTRFWPASRTLRPKQLLPLTGGDPLLAETVRRILPLTGGLQHILIATGAHLADATSALLPELPRQNLLIEPTPRNTAPCIAWAAATVARQDPERVLLVLPSDHHIADEQGFREVLAVAVGEAKRGLITTVGIQPTHPETGFGYLELEGPAAHAQPSRVVRFVEKPQREKAEAFLAGGKHLWNGGMFIFRARDMMDAVRAHLPELARGLDHLDRAALEGREAQALREVFPTLPSVSIDTGVMEKLPEIAVVPGQFGWSDVGSWHSAWELASKDAQGNSAPASAVLVDARNNHVVDLRTHAPGQGEPRVVALCGVEDLIVVQTDDALLVVPRERSQDVKLLVEALKARGQHAKV